MKTLSTLFLVLTLSAISTSTVNSTSTSKLTSTLNLTNSSSVKMPEVLNVKSRRTLTFSNHFQTIKARFVSNALLFTGLKLFGKDLNNIQMTDIHKEDSRKVINVPNILGLETLKCDFHMHTIFSDGVVWPTVRVDEAWQEGLDAIAITDHIENNPSKMFVGGDDNSSFEIAKPYAKKKNIILVRGGEISRDMPPGHFNALFLTDVNALDKENFMDAFEAAKKQGAFIVWNHPGWKAQQPDTCKWWDIHTKLFEKGMLNAVEVFNEKEFYPVTLDWCNEKNIAYMAASDIHGIIASTYNLDEYNRPLTLVFAKDRTEESLREALFAGRTVAWFVNYLAGKEEYLREIFEASINTAFQNENEHGKNYLVKNISDIPFTLVSDDGTSFILTANSESMVNIPNGNNAKFEVSNLLITTNQNLVVNFPGK